MHSVTYERKAQLAHMTRGSRTRRLPPPPPTQQKATFTHFPTLLSANCEHLLNALSTSGDCMRLCTRGRGRSYTPCFVFSECRSDNTRVTATLFSFGAASDPLYTLLPQRHCTKRSNAHLLPQRHLKFMKGSNARNTASAFRSSCTIWDSVAVPDRTIFLRAERLRWNGSM